MDRLANQEDYEEAPWYYQSQIYYWLKQELSKNYSSEEINKSLGPVVFNKYVLKLKRAGLISTYIDKEKYHYIASKGEHLSGF